ncbi:hypothetical protein [Streptomyces sp. NPDC048192]|uniref:hypothetical protein n=1 Tax=Streptomyces sp. NPDC048192 TaxID=3365510 RepID=UPI00372323B5
MTTPADLLSRAGIQNTAAHRAVVSILQKTPAISGADILVTLASDRADATGSPSTGELQRVLAELSAAGVVGRVSAEGDGDTHYHLMPASGQARLVCRRCGTRVQASMDTVHAHLPDLHGTGFSAVFETDVIWWGLCERCVQQNAQAQPQ